MECTFYTKLGSCKVVSHSHAIFIQLFVANDKLIMEQSSP
jgi:hypothetical protein